MTPPPPPVSGNQGDARSHQQSTIYKMVMTPIILISFIVSLTYVDFRHSVNRAHFHADTNERRTPHWLHRVLYRYRRYEYVAVDEQGKLLERNADGHYHSKQRKLMKMETAEAFEIRNTVLIILGMISVAILWGTWRILSWTIAVMGFNR
ncbi:hypothetical protein OQA88_10348 [Cercophora sp. LCS_1]